MRRLQIGIIPDGNRKYAKEHGISLTESYMRGATIAENIVKRALMRNDIEKIVFYALAKPNLELRNEEEVNAILKGINKAIELFERIDGVSVRVFGDNTCGKVKYLFDRKYNPSSRLSVSLLINYSPEWDLETRPIRTNVIPALDLIIRPREQKLSGFLPVQSANSQLYFPDCFWTDFTPSQFDRIIEDYKQNHLNRVSGK
jgi:undecaprenyl diphosphate synthase